jgi:uncharacterized protein YeaO (DUF488 family)
LEPGSGISRITIQEAKELDDKSGILARIKAEAKKGTVTLLFSARDTEHNNATVLRELLQ